ncbi:hypothetical protein [Tolypothrix sp. PCC 7601]|uniref:hypothetical protein n=2 Tax=unclassified Tolypothrix TaxID=2649714 RepID=UPI0014394268|nr:hypothetical protein [Tolypothrix sp. PCC 7601]
MREKLPTPITNYQLPITHYSLLITHYPMPHAQCPMPQFMSKCSEIGTKKPISDG